LNTAFKQTRADIMENIKDILESKIKPKEKQIKLVELIISDWI
jgi:hypothetical protein